MSFDAPYDKTTKSITAVVFVLLAVLTAAIRQPLVIAIGAATLIVCYGWSPRSYTVEGRTLIIRRLFGPVRISLANAREVRPATASDFSGAIRLFGNGGVFGYTGLFRTATLGKSTWYLTDRDKAVVVITESNTILISPGDPAAFLSLVQPAAPPSESRPLPEPYKPSRARYIIPAIGIAVAGVAVLVVILAVSYSPGPPDYTLTAQSLSIHDRFYPVTVRAADVDLSHIRVIDLDFDKDWTPTARTNGFANSHYRSGHFRLVSGRSVLLYWADGRRLVLLPPKGNGTPILLQTADPGRFLLDIHREWGESLP